MVDHEPGAATGKQRMEENERREDGEERGVK